MKTLIDERSTERHLNPGLTSITCPKQGGNVRFPNRPASVNTPFNRVRQHRLDIRDNDLCGKANLHCVQSYLESKKAERQKDPSKSNESF
jgi:hypothetical protein